MSFPSSNRTTSGFSLVELSIVLVILGLLVGGVLSGQSLIRAAELRSVSAEYQRYYTAVQSFRDKYFALPGDMTNAVRFWGAQAGATTDGMDATCAALNTGATGTATCNGDGDGRVEEFVNNGYEMFRFWQHLANAGLIEGSYSGVVGSGSLYHHILGTNAPRSKMNNAGWGFSNLENFLGDGNTYALDYGNMFWFGSVSSLSERPQGDILKPEEAWNIDTKVDDGRPATGKVIMRNNNTYTWGNAAACTTSTSLSDYAGLYNLSSSAVACALMIRQQ